MIVVDTSTIVYLVLPRQQTYLLEEVIAKDFRLIVPPLWKSEFLNMLSLYLRQGQMTIDQARAILTQTQRLLQHAEQPVNADVVLTLMTQSHCSAYDCEFVSLARRFGIPLVTADKKILKGFPKTAVSPQQFLAQ